MPTSVPGSKPRAIRRSQAGFTLLELLIVITVIALSTGLSVVALRDSSRAQLDQEAARLAALLDAARIESRASGRTVTWRPLTSAAQNPSAQAGTLPIGSPNPGSNQPHDFAFEPPVPGAGTVTLTGLPSGSAREAEAWPTRWLNEGTTAEVLGAPRVVLGPEPLIPPQRIRLQRGPHQVVLATNGLSGFQLEGSR